MIGSLALHGNKGGSHNGHAAVAFLFNGTRCHNARNAAARADQHRDERLAGQAELAEDTVHDERDARHVAAVLQDGQEDEQHENLRHEAQNRADTGDDAVHDQAVQPVGNAEAAQQVIQQHRMPGI